MKILTNDSLFKLKKLFKEDTDIVNKPFNKIVELTPNYICRPLLLIHIAVPTTCCFWWSRNCTL